MKTPQQYLDDMVHHGTHPAVTFEKKEVLKALTAQAQDHAQEMEALVNQIESIADEMQNNCGHLPRSDFDLFGAVSQRIMGIIGRFRSSRTGEGKEGVSKSTYSEYPNCSCRTDFVCPIHFKGDQ